MLALAATPSPAAPLVFAPYIALPTGSWSNAVAIGDLDGDGRNDVVVANELYDNPAHDNKLMVFFQEHGGVLGAPITFGGSSGRSVVVGDFNADGRLDIATTAPSGGINWYASAPSRTFVPQPTIGSAPYVLVVGADVNGDGRTDLVAAGWSASEVHVYYQLATGGFSAAVPVAVELGGWNDLKVVDVSGDGRPDIVFSSLQNPSDRKVGIAVQRPDGLFGAPYYSSHVFGAFAPWGIAATDINGDGTRDLVVSQAWNSPEARLIVLFNHGGTFDQFVNVPSYDIPESIQVADINMDGVDDVVVVHGGWNRAGVYERLSSGGLAPEMLLPIPYASHYGPQGIAVGDINADGRPDIVIGDYNSGLVVLYNLTGACTTFADVDSTDPFCRSVEWMRNRAITFGCSPYRFCAGDPISRAATAAFLNRLGTALVPVVRETVQSIASPFPVTDAPIVCATSPFPARASPRTVRVDAVLTALASADVDFAVWPVISLDGGSTWLQVGVVPGLANARAGHWTNVRVNTDVAIAGGQVAQVGLQLAPALGSSGTVNQGTCNVRSRVENRNGTTSPY